jgi:hypothetical protein
MAASRESTVTARKARMPHDTIKIDVSIPEITVALI